MLLNEEVCYMLKLIYYDAIITLNETRIVLPHNRFCYYCKIE